MSSAYLLEVSTHLCLVLFQIQFFCASKKLALLMPCPSTGPKIICAGPNISGQTKFS